MKTPAPAPHVLRNAAGLAFEVLANGVVRRVDCHGVVLNLFIGHEAEAGPCNLWLRRHGERGVDVVPLFGPASPSRMHFGAGRFNVSGEQHGLRWHAALVLAPHTAAWFWHVRVDNTALHAQTFDLLLVQDVALAPYAALRLNEHYVSHYVDITPLQHTTHGCVLAARQNLAVDGRHPWAVIGSLRHGVAYATDALQVHGLAARAGTPWPGLMHGLPSTRLQHEHALLAVQDAPLTLTATGSTGASAALGFFGCMQADHPTATDPTDLAVVDTTLALPQAKAAARRASVAASKRRGKAPAPTLFSSAPLLTALDFTNAEIDTLFGTERRHEEAEDGTLLSFFMGDINAEPRHVVLRAKELRVQRPHGHILRTGKHLVPDETSLTSTLWMAGVFHSMVTQGHVSINRFLSTAHSYLGLFRAHGQRMFVHSGGAWQLLGVPSAFEIAPDGCRWFYRHAGGLFTVRSRAVHQPHALSLEVHVLQGPPLRLLVTHHIALGGDDGSTGGDACWRRTAGAVRVVPPPGSALAERFSHGSFRFEPAPGSRFARVAGDTLLFADGRSRALPFVCIEGLAAPSFGLHIVGHLVDATPAEAATALPGLQLHAPAGSALAASAARLAEVVPWFTHNALVHYLAPRGLEQYSGGGWGTRDVCQGPLEMLLALGRLAPVRDLLLRTFAAQNADGDWPQWFMFFERDRHIRAGDSHGDIVFWPLLGLARYLLAGGDADLLDETVPFHGADAPATVWQHVQRALALIQKRRIPGTHLAAYGHGDWNDALQPAEPALRERLCSAWTVTLHHQMLGALVAALRAAGGTGHALHAAALEDEAALVHADFQRLLVADGVVTGYALFPPGGGAPGLLLHPHDTTTGLHYSLLPMMHAVLEDMLTPAQAKEQMALIAQHLHGPDGARLFDAPMAYRGGPQRIFQRAESSAHFGREIGVMYMHAHLRYAEALAHTGDAQGFFAALCRAHPIALREWVPSAGLRQANCYYSSSDAAFTDRYEAQAQYARVNEGSVRLDGGWRIYSSGPGIALSLLMRFFVGVTIEAQAVVLDPVLPNALDGLHISVEVAGRAFDISYRIGPAGCGPLGLTLNGQPLAFTRRANPYRSGAAVVERAVFEGLCTSSRNALVVQLG